MSLGKREAPKTEGPQLKRIDMQSGKFQANGKTYYIQSDMSLLRFVEYTKLQSELAYGATFKDLHGVLTKIFQAASSGNDLIGANHTCRELAYNQINAIIDFTSRDHPTLFRFCSLFINSENEDLTMYDDRLVDQKIQDWTQEGINVEDFFFLAANFIPNFRTKFQELVATKKGLSVEELVKMSRPADSTLKTSSDSSRTTSQKGPE